MAMLTINETERPSA